MMSGGKVLLVFILFSFTNLQLSETRSGKVCSRRESYYYSNRICVYRLWYRHVCSRREGYYYSATVCTYRLWRRRTTKTGYRTINSCCPGWKDTNDGKICTMPVCSSKCYNGGTCVSPNKCSCPIGYSGDVCAQRY